MRDYDDLQSISQQLSLAAAFHAAGRLDTFLKATGETLLGDEEFLCCYFYELLFSLADFTDIRGSDDGCVSRYYFSDESIRTYFGFVQRHAAQQGIPFQEDPYYRNALDYFNDTMLSACPYSCWFRLVTQTHHKYGYGLSVWTDDEQFCDTEQLIFSLLDVLSYFEHSVILLRAQGKLPEKGRAVPFVSPKQKETA